MGIKVERPLPVEGQAARITELWAWTNIDPMTDTEGIVAVKSHNGGALPMVFSMRSMAERYRPLAEEFIRSAQEPRPTLHLRRFVAEPAI